MKMGHYGHTAQITATFWLVHITGELQKVLEYFIPLLRFVYSQPRTSKKIGKCFFDRIIFGKNLDASALCLQLDSTYTAWLSFRTTSTSRFFCLLQACRRRTAQCASVTMNNSVKCATNYAVLSLRELKNLVFCMSMPRSASASKWEI